MDFHEFIEKEIIPQYAEFDAAHREDHVRSVISKSQELAKFYPVKPEILYLAAAYHDLGLSEGASSITSLRVARFGRISV